MTAISTITVYPLKSARGIALSHATVEGRGLRFDRRWMVVDGGGTFISQRTHPLLSLIETAIDTTHLTLTVSGRGVLRLPLSPAPARRRDVIVWDDTVSAQVTGPEADDWISGVLGEQCSIVYFPDDACRRVDTRFSHGSEETAFSDGFPVLLLAQASLDDLNRHLQIPVPMNRFRPNIVVDGCAAFAEDEWRTVDAGTVRLELVKPCARCVITTIDQQTTARGNEPLAALSLYRNRGGKVLFGQNALVIQSGTITVGDEVTGAR
jgi:hypothetical protein